MIAARALFRLRMVARHPAAACGDAIAWCGRTPRRRRRALTAAAFVTAWVVLAALIPLREVALLADEIAWKDFGEQMLRAYAHTVVTGEGADDPIWREWNHHYGYANPRVGAYVAGATFIVARKLYDATGHLYFGALIWALTATLFFRLGRHIRGEDDAAGAIAFGLLMLNAVFENTGVEMMLEAPLALFTVATLLALTKAREAKSTAGYLAWSLGAGIAAGLAVSSKLYGFAAIATFALAAAADLPRRRGWVIPASLLAAAAAVAIFVGTNPLMWTDPRLALTGMTFGHVASTAETTALGSADSWRSLAYLATMPFMMFRGAPFPGGDLPVVEWWTAPLVAAGWAAFGLGIAALWRARRALPLMFFASTFALQGWVVGTHLPSWTMPRIALLPAIAVVWIQAHGVRAIGEFRRGKPDEM